LLKVKIKENSFRAQVASFNLQSKQLAMVWGSTILLHNTSRAEFLANSRWVNHELRHVWQVRKMGLSVFLLRYLLLSIRYGYKKHPYELDAQRHEQDDTLLHGVEFI
jgi:hypothetical protein